MFLFLLLFLHGSSTRKYFPYPTTHQFEWLTQGMTYPWILCCLCLILVLPSASQCRKWVIRTGDVFSVLRCGVKASAAIAPSTSEMLFCIPLFELLLPFCQLELVWPLLIFTFWPTELLLLLCVWKLEVTSFEILKPPCCSTSNNSTKSSGHISS